MPNPPMSKHIYRFIKHIIVWILVELPLTLIGIPVLAIALLFIPREATELPRYLKWFDSWDVGLQGNGRYYDELKDKTGWWGRFNWLALRNPINYFNYKVMGCKPDSGYMWYIKTGDLSSYTEVSSGNKIYYEYFYEKPYTVFNSQRIFHFKLGWKFGGRAHKGVYEWALQVQPWKTP